VPQAELSAWDIRIVGTTVTLHQLACNCVRLPAALHIAVRAHPAQANANVMHRTPCIIALCAMVGVRAPVGMLCGCNSKHCQEGNSDVGGSHGSVDAAEGLRKQVGWVEVCCCARDVLK
jgi:hypothetical protein